ncbi:HNH endonuclease [Nosocomiicoccus ampullae]|nr:HNH endonuclease [Nosocomiicoccus ampullae]
MLQEKDCFTPFLQEAIYVLVFEMDGKGSAKQISEITGRPYQVYNTSMAQTVKRLRKKGYTFETDLRNKSKKKRYWCHFFNGYYEKELFIWEVKDSLQEAFMKYIGKFDRDDALTYDNELANEYETIEGMKRHRTHYQIERNSKIINIAKKEFIKKHGELFCEACNFSFEKTYEIEFIEAHHILPLYMGKRRTRKIDLIMLCANCHRAVHNKKWIDKPIDEFLEYMKNKSIKY